MKIENTSEQKTPAYILNYDHLGVIMWKPEALETILNQEINRLDKYDYFTVEWDHEVFTYDYLAEKEPELFEKMKKALLDYKGRLGIGSCTYGQPLSTFINEESNIRQLTVARKTLIDRFHKTPAFYIMSEHAFHAQLPQILLKCGFKGALLRTHFMMYGYNPECNASVVRWTGIDKSAIPAIPTYKGQAVFIGREKQSIGALEPKYGAVTLDNRILLDSPARYNAALEEFRTRFENEIGTLVASRADDPRQLEEIIPCHRADTGYIWTLGEEVMKRLPAPETAFYTEPEDFNARMPWGFCGNWMLNRSREAEVKVLIAERLCAMACLLGDINDGEAVEEAWKKLLVGQHHDIQIVGIEEDAHTYLDAAVSGAEALIKKKLEFIRANCDVGDGEVLVFNPLQWDRTEWIDYDTGFTACVPGLGFKALGTKDRHGLSAMEWHPEKNMLTTPYYHATFGENGGIKSLRDAHSRRDLLETDRLSGVLTGDIDGSTCVSSGRAEVILETQRARIKETGLVGTVEYVMEWIFYNSLKRIDWKCTINTHREKIGLSSEDRGDDKSAFLHEKKLRLRFYPAVSPCAAAVRDLPFAVSVTGDRYINGNYWTALADDEHGLALFNKGLMGSIREEDGAFSVPVAFSMYYVWDGCLDGVKVSDHSVSSMTEGSVNDGPHFMQGEYRYELGILPYEGDWKQAGIHKRALEYNFPCVAVGLKQGNGGGGNEWTPLRVRSNAAILSALYFSKGDIYVRFYENQGESDKVILELDGAAVQLKEVDMLEAEQTWQGDELILKPWQICTVKLER
jgi:hypothetical protein